MTADDRIALSDWREIADLVTQLGDLVERRGAEMPVSADLARLRCRVGRLVELEQELIAARYERRSMAGKKVA